MNSYMPYTYLIGWSTHNKWYYGVRYAIDCNPSDFWNTYFTSSKEVSKFREQYGDPNIRKIHKKFNDALSARLFEHKMLKRMRVTKKDKWLNRHDGTSPEPLYGDKNPMRSPLIAKKQSESLKNSNVHPSKTNNFQKQQSLRMIALGDNHPFKKEENRYSIKGDNNPSRRIDLKKQCTYCGKMFSPTNFIRWHDTKCKKFNILS